MTTDLQDRITHIGRAWRCEIVGVDAWAISVDVNEARRLAQEIALELDRPLSSWPICRPAPKKSKTQRRRERIFARDGHRCVSCGATDALTIDHVIPRSKGGGNTADNLQTLCAPCNFQKADTLP